MAVAPPKDNKEDFRKMGGPQKAAMFLMAIGEENAIKLFALMDDDEIFYLKSIQSNRNGIHSFEERTIGTWDNLQYCVRFWCYLLEWIMNRLPDVPDYN